jgi:hypothetical protein
MCALINLVVCLVLTFPYLLVICILSSIIGVPHFAMALQNKDASIIKKLLIFILVILSFPLTFSFTFIILSLTSIFMVNLNLFFLSFFFLFRTVTLCGCE